tara:strand:+ start:99 stop:977 length:879 start_codon:yes stop_codon:yes gene_type:complete
MRDQYSKEIETDILNFPESETDIKKTKKVLDLIKELELRGPLSQKIINKRDLLKKKLIELLSAKTKIHSTALYAFFSGAHNSVNIILRINNTNRCTTKLLSLIYNGELIEDEELNGSEEVFGKLNKLDETSALFSLNVKFYNFHLKDLSFKPVAITGTIAEFIHKEGDRSEIVDDVLGFSLPYKEEAIQILLYIGNIIISKNPSIQIVGGVNIDNAANKVSLLFSKKIAIQEQVVETSSQKVKGRAKKSLQFSSAATSAATPTAASALITHRTYTPIDTSLKNATVAGESSA